VITVDDKHFIITRWCLVGVTRERDWSNVLEMPQFFACPGRSLRSYNNPLSYQGSTLYIISSRAVPGNSWTKLMNFNCCSMTASESMAAKMAHQNELVLVPSRERRYRAY
jgi:hypothetical protein